MVSGRNQPENGPKRGPEPLGEILSRLFTTRGWGRKQGQLQLEQVWREVVGPEHASHTRVGSIRRGVLEIIVDNATLMQELVSFHRRKLLDQLRKKLPKTTLTDLRFRAGVLD